MNPGHPNQLAYGTLDAVTGLPTAPTSYSGLSGVANYRWDTAALAWVRVSGGTTTGPDVNVTNFPASQTINGSVAVSNFPATQAVSIAGTVATSDTHTTAASFISVRLTDGTSFYSATGGAGGNLATAAKGTTTAGNPTSEATDANTQSLHVRMTNASVPVTGTFFQGTQPVSGTFWQATQPVSIASMPSTPVTGTFWQTTQPVSLATNTPDVTDRAGRLLGTISNTAFAANAGTNLNTSALALEAGHLATIDTQTARIPAQGQTTKSASLPVTMASDQGPYVDQEWSLSPGLNSLRDQLFAQRYTVLADSVADGFAGFWSFTTANGGTAAVSIGEGLLQTGTQAGGLAQMVSTAPAYYPGQVHWLNSAIRYGDLGVAGTTLRIGACTVSGTTPQDGFFYELNGTTLNAVTVKAGVQTVVSSGGWTRFAANPFTLDTNYHQFELRWTANRGDFLVDNTLRHTGSGGATALTGTLNFPMFLQVSNPAGGSNRVLAVRNIGLGRFGTPDVTPVSLSAVTLNGSVSVSNFPASIDGDQFDDEGFRYVNPNVPGADIATGDKQTAILNALLQILTTPGQLGVINSIAVPVTVSAVNSIPLAANAAVENVGNLQRIADNTEAMLMELKVLSVAVAQLQQPQSDGVEQLRNDFQLIQ